MQVFDIEDPEAPVHLGAGGTHDAAIAVGATDQRIYQAAGFGWMEIFLPQCEAGSAAPDAVAHLLDGVRLVASPGVFASATTISFVLPEPHEVELTVHAVDGRRIARLGEQA